MTLSRNSVFPLAEPLRLSLNQDIDIFASPSFKKLAEFHYINIQAVSMRYDMSNGGVELLFYYLKKGCRLVSSMEFGQWDVYLPYLVQSINSRITIFGYSPEEILFFNTTRKISPIQMDSNFSNVQEFVRNLSSRLKIAWAQFIKDKSMKEIQIYISLIKTNDLGILRKEK